MPKLLSSILTLGTSLIQTLLWLSFLRRCLPRKAKCTHPAVSAGMVCGMAAAFALSYELPAGRDFLMLIPLAAAMLLSLWTFDGTVLRRVVWSAVPVAAASFAGLLAFQIGSIFGESEAVYIVSVAAANVLLWMLLRKAKRYLSPAETRLGDEDLHLMTALLAAVTVLYLLLRAVLCVGVGQTASWLLCAAAVLLVTAIGGAYHLLAALHQKNRAALEEQLLTQQKNDQLRFDELKYQVDTLQKAKHDFHNTLQVIRSLNGERKPAQVEAYLASYLDAVQTADAYVATNSDYVNAIVNAKTAEARGRGIAVENVIAADIGASDPVDICNIIGNLFDNAITACEKAAEHPRIRFHMSAEGEETVLTMKNTIASSVLSVNPQLATGKADRANHGYGTKIIRETAEKYGGYADFYEERGEFCCRVVLYLE